MAFGGLPWFTIPVPGGALWGAERAHGGTLTGAADARKPAPEPRVSGPARGPAPGLDVTRAHPAWIYDYWLGGKDNFRADREAAEQAIKDFPGIVPSVRAQRAFLGEAVRYLAGEAGVRQFLNIGTGIPAADNTHEVA